MCFLLWTPTALHAQSGVLDPTFNGAGYAISPIGLNSVASKVLVQDDQKILVVGNGSTSGSTVLAYTFRYLPDGTPDMTFAVNGVSSYELNTEAIIHSAVLTSDGKIVMVGSTWDNVDRALLLIRINADGSLDGSFGTNGVVAQNISVAPENKEDVAYDVVLDDEDNILICGTTDDEINLLHPFVARLSANGILDPAFGMGGIVTMPSSDGSGGFKGIAVQSNGSILASGYSANGAGNLEMLVVRLTDEGNLDPAFGNTGVVVYSNGGVADIGEDLKVTSDGSVLVTGITSALDFAHTDARLVKFTPTGEVDASFGIAGAVVEDMNTYDVPNSVNLMSDGKILMAGFTGWGPPGVDLAVWKYLADGTPDLTFGTNGLAIQVVPDHSTEIKSVGIQADGKLVFSGLARSMNFEQSFFVGRLQNDVTIDVAEMVGIRECLVFPNPITVGSLLTVRFPEEFQPDTRISILAPDGRVVFTAKYSSLQREAQQVRFQLPAELAPGIYQLALGQQSSNLSTSILIPR